MPQKDYFFKESSGSQKRGSRVQYNYYTVLYQKKKNPQLVQVVLIFQSVFPIIRSKNSLIFCSAEHSETEQTREVHVVSESC